MAKRGNVDRRQGEYIVTSFDRTREGIWQMNAHFSRVPEDAPPEELGRAVLAALRASRGFTFRKARRTDRPDRPLLAALGLKTYRQYAEGTLSVSFGIGKDGRLRITPMRNGGPGEGFVELTSKEFVVEDRSAPSVGRAVRHGLVAST